MLGEEHSTPYTPLQSPSQVERSFQKSLGIDARKKLIPKLSSFQLNLGTAPHGNHPTVVYLVLTNPGDLPVEFTFESPADLILEAGSVPFWHDEVGGRRGGRSCMANVWPR